MEGKMWRLSTPISEQCFILCRAPVSLRPPPAESSFEVIMGLLAKAPLQVPLAASPLSVSQHGHIDEKRWESFQSLQMRPIFLLSASFTFLCFICQPHLLHPHTIYCFAGTACHFQVLLLPSNSFYTLSTALALHIFTQLNCCATLKSGRKVFKVPKNNNLNFMGEENNFPSWINNT